LLDKDETGKGIISRSVNCLDNLLFEIGFERIVMGAATANKGTQGIAKRCGYTLDGIERNAYYSRYNQKHHDIMCFSKIKGDGWTK